jgi:flagellar secretion chaperone FliS
MTASPMELVRMLYRFIIDNLGEASRCTMAGDIEGRGKAVSKATEGFLELLTSLDHEQGGDVSRNLAELYGYMASRVLDGHVNQVSAPFDEVERLMSTLLDGWENLGAQHIPAAPYAPISASF